MAEGKVLVVGASGRTGQRVVNALRQYGFPVRALVRNTSSHGLADDEGVEVVVSALGAKTPTDPAHIELIEYTTIAELAQLAQEMGVSQFVLCSSMGVEIPDMIPPLAEILRQKRRGELALENSGVPFTIVRPGGLTDEPGGGGVAAARTLHGFGTISRDDVAEVMVQELLQPEAKNKIVEVVNAPDAGPADRADLFASITLPS